MFPGVEELLPESRINWLFGFAGSLEIEEGEPFNIYGHLNSESAILCGCVRAYGPLLETCG